MQDAQGRRAEAPLEQHLTARRDDPQASDFARAGFENVPPTNVATAESARHADVVAPFRLALGAEHLHRCGPRAVAEFLVEIGQRHDLTAELAEALEAWRRLDPRMVSAVLMATCGSRQFPVALAVLEGRLHA